MSEATITKFQFNEFKIIKSYFDMSSSHGGYALKLNFFPKGLIKKEDSTFELELNVLIEEKNNKFKADIVALGTYKFDNEVDVNSLDNLFFINAPAILFPYIRAYISALTTLSGLKPINLPTLNLSQIGAELRQNTTTIE